MEKETVYLMERDDGVIVRVPESKLEQFDPSDTEITERHRRLAEAMVRRLRSRYSGPRQS